MRIGKRIGIWLITSVFVLVTGGCAAVLLYSEVSAGTPLSEQERLWERIAWRTELYFHKAIGDIKDLSWIDLWFMTRVRGGFGLEAALNEGRSLDGSITNPFVSVDDQEAGARIFRERCSVCHGGDGVGRHGPALNRPGLKHGDSDLAIYKVVRDGIPSTPMIAAQLQTLERWQVVGYIRGLQTDGLREQHRQRADLNITVSRERLREAGSRPDEWLTYSGSFDGRRYAPAHEINAENVSKLRVWWIRQFDSNATRIEATPLVVDGVLFLSDAPGSVVALDARSGTIIWRYSRSVPAALPTCCGRVNRGLAILGERLFLGTLDGYLVALDASTGRLIWEARVADPKEGYTLTGAPLIADGLVVVGVAGGEYGIRGHLTAYDAATGRQAWRFFTIPGPGEAGHKTWGGDGWRTGGGATWATGSYDATLGLIYWGVGNPAPVYSTAPRPGDNLYSNSVIALDSRSGKLAWHFQFTPNDEHDWDSAQTPILTDVPIDGRTRKVICWPNRNGFYYVLDRVTGKFLTGTAFVEQNWTKGLDSGGRPIPVEAAKVSAAGRLTKPGVMGGTNWQNPAFDNATGLIYIHATESASVFTKSAKPVRGDGGLYLASAGPVLRPVVSLVRALDAATGKQRWEHQAPPSEDFFHSYSGLLATRGGLVFGASAGHAFALNSRTGEELWRVFLGGETVAAPISFTVEGHQVVAISAGRALFMFGL